MMKNTHIWMPYYLRQKIQRKIDFASSKAKRPIHLYFSLVDHYEPYCGGASPTLASKRVEEWCKKYPQIASKYSDSNGNPPKHTFFYPSEEYDENVLDSISEICQAGFGDVEIHLHHDNDTAERLRGDLLNFKKVLYEKHNLLRKHEKTGEIIYGFIHGNWALDNSRRDGRWCGVNNEIQILKETGCYADFTLPSAPSDTQTRKVNSIYYAIDDPQKPKSHDSGKDVASGIPGTGDLMIIQGPLCLNWHRRKYGFVPRIENAELSHENKFYPERVKLWIDNSSMVEGAPGHLFIKIHTHGCDDNALHYLLNRGLDELYTTFCQEYNDGKKYELHFVSSYEMYNVIKTLESDT